MLRGRELSDHSQPQTLNTRDCSMVKNVEGAKRVSSPEHILLGVISHGVCAVIVSRIMPT